MSRRKWSILTAIFFLVSSLAVSQAFSYENLLPQSKVSPSYSENDFKKIYESVCIGLFIYRLDAFQQCAKENLIKYLSALLRDSEVKFDLENIDIGKKGWTRYYPFSISEKSFIMRIFLTEELRFQFEAPVLYEGILTNPAVTFQVLPGINEIVAGRKAEPIRIHSTRPSDSSS